MSDEVKFKKLTGENWNTWKFNMKMLLMGKDIWDIVTGDDILPEEANEERRRKHKGRDQLAMSLICLKCK